MGKKPHTLDEVRIYIAQEGYELKSSEYIRAVDTLSVFHPVCGNVFSTSFKRFLRGDRCPKCFGTPKKTHSDFVQQVSDLHGESYRVIGRYVNNKEKVEVEHTDENGSSHTYLVAPVKILAGRTCPICSKRQKKTTFVFAKEVSNMTGGEYEVLGEYVNNATPILIRHNSETCKSHEYNVKPMRFICGDRCPKCNSLRKHSKAHLQIKDFLLKEGIHFEEEVKFDECRNKKPLAFDFGIHTGGNEFILVEYDGSQHDPMKFASNNSVWRESQQDQLKRDSIKNAFCQENGITLIRIDYTEDHMTRIREVIDQFVKGRK